MSDGTTSYEIIMHNPEHQRPQITIMNNVNELDVLGLTV